MGPREEEPRWTLERREGCRPLPSNSRNSTRRDARSAHQRTESSGAMSWRMASPPGRQVLWKLPVRVFVAPVARIRACRS